MYVKKFDLKIGDKVPFSLIPYYAPTEVAYAIGVITNIADNNIEVIKDKKGSYPIIFNSHGRYYCEDRAHKLRMVLMKPSKNNFKKAIKNTTDRENSILDWIKSSSHYKEEQKPYIHMYDKINKIMYVK